MNIIIVGCGKVGSTLAVQLARENNNICVIDVDKKRVQDLTSANDIIGICGNGTNYSLLLEAGIAETDLLIAVTGSDEMNLLCCVIAHKAAQCKVIARVRNPIYEREVEFLKKELGLTMIINPELLTAQEMFQILRFPNAMEISFFSRGQMEMIRYRIPQDSMLHDLSIKRISSEIQSDILIFAVENGGKVMIPTGDTVLHSGDMIWILTTRKNALDFFHSIHVTANTVKNTMIIGGGKIAVYLARMLIKSGINVKIIESNESRCEELSDMLPEATIIHGDGSNELLLKEERINQMDSFVALTNFDEENILLSLFAMKNVKKKVVTKINRFQLSEVIYNLDLDSVVYPKNLTTERILKYVRSTRNSVGGKISKLYRLCEDKVEVLEFMIKESSTLTNVPIYKLNLKSDILIGCIIRDEKSIIPKGDDLILAGDSIIVVTTRLGLNDAMDILDVH